VQLAFSFDSNNEEKFSEKNFIQTPENSSAYKFLEKFFNQDLLDHTQFPSIILKGEKDSGKTHLLNIFAKKYQAEFIDISILNDNNPLNIFTKNKFFIIDDFSLIEKEERILSIINSANESRVFLLLSDHGQRKFELKDLNSRLKNIFSIEIKDPSHETIKILLSNFLSLNQIKIANNLIDELVFSCPRNYSSLNNLLKRIENLYQENNQKIDKNIISTILLN